MNQITRRVAFFIFFVNLLFVQNEVFSASEESSELQTEAEQQRLQKFQNIQPPNQSNVERGLVWLEGYFLEGVLPNYKGFTPQVGTITSGSSIAFGGLYWKPNIGGSLIDLQISGGYSILGYQEYELQIGRITQKSTPFLGFPHFIGDVFQFGDIRQEDRDFFLYADLDYLNFPQQDFFGIGLNSLEDNRTNYKLEGATYDAVVGYQFNRWLHTGLRVGFIQVNIDRGTDESIPTTQEVFNDISAPGLARQPDFFRLSSSLIFNYRDVPGNPHRGGVLGFMFTRYEDLDEDQFSFNRFAFDARHYLPLGSPARVLAFRFFTSLDDTDKGNRVPFYLQETLGGSNTLQGFRSFRFQDTNLLYFAAEYRWEALDYLEFALFYDTGKVFADRSDFNLTDLEDSYGFGVRFKTPSSVIFRFDTGHSVEGTQFYFAFGSTF